MNGLIKTATKFRRAIAAVICIAAAASILGCEAILEGETESIVLHTGSSHSQQPEGVIEASSYDGLKAAMLDMVLRRDETGLIRVNTYEDDLQADVDRACLEIKTAEPYGAFALSDITGRATQIVSYFEVELSLAYKRSKRQIDSVVTASTLRYFKSELLNFMSAYLSEAAVLTGFPDISDEDVLNYIREIYYENPRRVIMMPSTVVELFPDSGDEKIVEMTFVYGFAPGFLSQYVESLTAIVQRIAKSVSGGDNDGAILLDLAVKLMDSCVYDAGLAETVAEHGIPNPAVTAYGALVGGSAVGEGYAMAYKALCDELDIECHVVLGERGGMVHAWNIVALYDDYYHIDVAMCAEDGVGTAFLMTDEQFAQNYSWDRENEKPCAGALTYRDISGVPEEGEAVDGIGGIDGVDGNDVDAIEDETSGGDTGGVEQADGADGASDEPGAEE